MIVSDPDRVESPAAAPSPDTAAAATATTPVDNSFRDEQIRHLAYELWERRNCPIGDPEADWYKAKVILFGHQES